MSPTAPPAPCPFCGNAPYVIEDDSYGKCSIGCNCEAEPSVFRRTWEIDACIAAWNRRSNVEENGSSPAVAAPRTSTAEDASCMGTPEEARQALIDMGRRWRELRQPLIASAAQHKKRDAMEREARFQLANAALHWLWHEEQP